MSSKNRIEIPTPHELLASAEADHNKEAEEIIARVVRKLRVNPTSSVVETGTTPALTVASLQLQSKGWVCQLWRGDQRDPEPSMTVSAPAILRT